MTVHFRLQGEYLLIVGHTFPHRDKIRSLGAFFDRNDKVWKLRSNPENQKLLEDFCEGLGGSFLNANSVNRSPEKNQIEKKESPSLPVAVQKSTDDLSIADLMSRVHMSIQESFPGPVWVVGEVDHLNERGIGYFLNLSEPKAQSTAGTSGSITVSAVLWKNTWRQLATSKDLSNILCEGMQVRVLCQVGFYRDRGMLSLNIVDIDPAFTKGALALAREALLKELSAQGLDRKNKDLKLSPFPLCVGLISAEGSRAKSDFLDQLKSYGFPGTVIFQDARMQGESLVNEVCMAIDALEVHGCDLIVLTRGGGSAADLRWFDAKEVALAIANSSVPVLAAIGHHEDTCIAEIIAFRREKTPTAAADFIINQFTLTQVRLDRLSQQIIDAVQLRVKRYEEKHFFLSEKIFHVATVTLNHLNEELFKKRILIESRSQEKFLKIENLFFQYEQKIEHLASSQIMRLSNQLMKLEMRIREKDPHPWLKEGWTQLYDEKQKVKSADQVDLGSILTARLLDGKLKLKVEDKKFKGI